MYVIKDCGAVSAVANSCLRHIMKEPAGCIILVLTTPAGGKLRMHHCSHRMHHPSDSQTGSIPVRGHPPPPPLPWLQGREPLPPALPRHLMRTPRSSSIHLAGHSGPWTGAFSVHLDILIAWLMLLQASGCALVIRLLSIYPSIFSTKWEEANQYGRRKTEKQRVYNTPSLLPHSTIHIFYLRLCMFPVLD